MEKGQTEQGTTTPKGEMDEKEEEAWLRVTIQELREIKGSADQLLDEAAAYSMVRESIIEELRERMSTSGALLEIAEMILNIHVSRREDQDKL
ncbi:DgyrCDS13564 [Dimorphilus gyrociliatus]|uniref:DgyrCDS13564 n=1 Tax=Dimorphilus gyrociliatus TaxID=2664684 RepID=A0A7I8WB03_9ANNE|nr:DgyrCDS13564 [Dimorphilus gyrociliatus]